MQNSAAEVILLRHDTRIHKKMGKPQANFHC